MSFQFLLPWPFLSLLCFLSLVLVKIHPSLSDPDIHRSCSNQFRCGTITAGYPFWGGERQENCGHPDLKLKCEGDKTTMKIGDVIYRVFDVDPIGQVLRIARNDIFEGLCPQNNTTIDETLLHLSVGYETLTLLYACPMIPGPFTCYMKDIIDYRDGFIQTSGDYNIRPGCNMSVNVTVHKDFLAAAKGDIVSLEHALEKGFQVKWNLDPCDKNCDSCGYDIVKKEGICYCPDGQVGNSTGCQTSTEGSFFNKTTKISLGSVAGLLGMIIILVILWKKKTKSYSVLTFWWKETENDQHMEAFIRNYRSLAPKRYNYSDVKRMIKSFNNKLGKGGYGEVYKGNLPDGRLVAVKVLKESKSNGEEFINEVASISRTSHVNIVNLLGFCYEKTKRALIYEFMPNGSLDKFICDQETSSTKSKLEWRTKFQIAVGIARGLEYLHRGCNIRIVHFDIKPHNILLDEDFCPKISDFGLAKSYRKKESIMSMLDARGTIGYIAPEVFCRTFGGVSHKSDVYSYGMMILEMVGGRKNVDARVSHSSENYFPNSIYKHLEPGNDFQFHGVVTEEEKETVKKMIMVSLWCIQTNPSDRPSMTKVVELLEGSLESLQIPPKPTLSLPTVSDKLSSASPSSLSTQLA